MPRLVFILLVSVWSVWERGVQQDAAGQFSKELVTAVTDTSFAHETAGDGRLLLFPVMAPALGL